MPHGSRTTDQWAEGSPQRPSESKRPRSFITNSAWPTIFAARLEDASREYARALELDPPRDLNDEEWRLVRRFAPRVYVTASEFFPLKDFAVILHPAERLIAYHFFWEDDIDFPEDNDPCDHELIWVKYSADSMSIENILTYFHGRILDGGEAALSDARATECDPASMCNGANTDLCRWDGSRLKIIADPGDAEKKYYPLDQPISLKLYNEGTFRKLSEEGRRLADHPLGAWAGRGNSQARGTTSSTSHGSLSRSTGSINRRWLGSRVGTARLSINIS